MENVNIYKFILRIAKNNGNFQKLKSNVIKRVKQMHLKITPKQYIEERIKNSNNLTNFVIENIISENNISIIDLILFGKMI